MAKAAANATIGFLTVVEHEQHGLFGGYLLLNMLGRPLEFHCTTPVKPNRAQQILYGPTLDPFLYGETIGQTLLSKASVEAEVICTDLPAVLALRRIVSLPLALVTTEDAAKPETDTASSGKTFRVDAPGTRRAFQDVFHIGRNALSVDVLYAGDARLVQERLAGLDEQFDLQEPFARIREAIQEAQGSSR
ncbi:MAG: hypothetical protein AB7O62_18145 [Pirellulales bacterium]